MSELTDNDRLLELAGGHRHTWKPVLRAGAAGRDERVCECGATWLHRVGKDDGNPPAVGDGHEMTLGEMVRLAGKVFGPQVRVVIDLYGSDGCVARIERIPGWPILAQRAAATPEAALTAAILAAVDAK